MSDKQGSAAVIGVVTAVVLLVGALIKVSTDFDKSPLNPANQPVLSWHEVRSSISRPVDGKYGSRIEIHIHNKSRVVVEHIQVLVKTLGKEPCINCEDGKATEATDGEQLVEIPKLTGFNSVKIVVMEWLPEYPKRLSMFDDDDDHQYAGSVVKVTYEKGPIPRNDSLCKTDFKKPEPIAPPPANRAEPKPGLAPAPEPPRELTPKHSAPQVVQTSPAGCGCGSSSCRCGAGCRCIKIVAVPRRVRRK